MSALVIPVAYKTVRDQAVIDAAVAYQATGRIDSFAELDRLFAAVDALTTPDRHPEP